MSADAETLAFLTKDPEGFLAYFVESSDAVGLAYPEWFVTHGKIVAGIYGIMIAICMWGIWARWYRGKLWFVRRTATGVFRPNGSVLILLLLAIYSLEWIGLISWDVLHHDHSGYYGTETWQLVVFFPLSLAGWVQVYSTVCAIPFRQGLLKTERKAIYRTRMSRFLESAILRNVLLVANPCIYLVVLLVTCIPAGHYQAKAYRAARDATDLIKEAIANGNQWKSIADLLACAEGLQRLQTSFAGVIRWVNRGSTVVLVWVIVEGSIFVIASVTLLKIINRQISQLKRTLRSAETLRNLSLAAVHDIRAPSIAFFDPSQRYLELPPLKSQHETLEEDVGVERGAGLSSAVMNEESLADVRHKLARMMTFRKVYIFSVCATGYAMFAAVAYGAFGAAGGFYINNITGRDVPLYVPVYGFLLPAALPASIINTYFFLHHSKPASKTPPQSRIAVTPGTPGTAAEDEWAPPPVAVLPKTQQWEAKFSSKEEEHKSSLSKSSNSIGGNGSLEEASGSMHAVGMSSPRGRPSDWARGVGAGIAR